MHRDRFSPLPQAHLDGLQCDIADVSAERRVRLDSPALEVMTDLRQVPAATVDAGMSQDEAHRAMQARGVRLLLVTDAARGVVGLVTAADFLGGLDTIVVSAGTSGRTPILDTPPEEFRRIVDNNLMPPFLAARYGAAHLIAAGAGSIIIISSMYGLVGQKERVAYCGAKHGAIGMVKSMALDLAESGVRVNAICPGFIETPLSVATAQQEADPEAAMNTRRRMHAIPRSGRVDEVAEMAVYLASDLAGFVTGQALAIDGGYTAR